MPWASHAVIPLADSTMTDMSGGALAVMAVVIVVCLGALLIPVMLAGRPPRHPQQRGPARGARPLEGGTHPGDPRSVAPPRDAPAEPVSPGSGGDER